MAKKIIRVINVPEECLSDLGYIATALGISKQEVYRRSLEAYRQDNLQLVAAGGDIRRTQAALRKE